MNLANPLIKKRANDRGNEQLWAYNQQDFIPCSYGDRFIPRRYASGNNNQIQNIFRKKGNIQGDVLELRSEKAYWRRHNYEVSLCKVFDLNEKRMYRFHDSNIFSNILNKYNIAPRVSYPMDMNKNVLELDWPCKPRSKPLVCADSTHDLPNFADFSDSNILSWSKRGQVAASFGTDLVIWSPDTDETVLYKIGHSKALAFCPKGNYIAVGSIMNLPVVRLWDVGCDNLLIYTNHVFLQWAEEKITCIEWLPTGAAIVCGTAVGTVYALSVPSLTLIVYFRHNQHKIVSIKFNPKSTYFATIDCIGNVYIYFWPSCKLKSKIKTNGLQRLVDWHPWNGTDLAICDVFPASIRIVNVVKNEVLASYKRRDSNCYIDALSFNKISGELVVSYLIKESNNNFVCKIFVMASLNRIVDVLTAHEDRVKVLLWNPDGTQLATAGNDDTLTIWNFFAFRDKKYIKKPVPVSKEPTPELSITGLSRFGVLK